MAAPGPGAVFDKELRYAGVGNGSAVARGDRGGYPLSVPVPHHIQSCALVQDLLARKASAWHPIGWPFRAPDFPCTRLRQQSLAKVPQ